MTEILTATAEILYHGATSGLLGFLGGLFMTTAIGEMRQKQYSFNFFGWTLLCVLLTFAASAIFWLPSLASLPTPIWTTVAGITIAAWLSIPLVMVTASLDPRKFAHAN